jgi:hypothetical protein
VPPSVSVVAAGMDRIQLMAGKEKFGAAAFDTIRIPLV